VWVAALDLDERVAFSLDGLAPGMATGWAAYQQGVAWAVEGCYGARVSGAGFGGCTLSLVNLGAVERFKAAVSAAYVAAVGREPTIYVCQTADGVAVVA
jgi:galactokinase